MLRIGVINSLDLIKKAQIHIPSKSYYNYARYTVREGDLIVIYAEQRRRRYSYTNKGYYDELSYCYVPLLAILDDTFPYKKAKRWKEASLRYVLPKIPHNRVEIYGTTEINT